MVISVMAGFLLALLSPLMYRLAKQYTGWLLALLPLSLTLYYASFINRIAHGEVILDSYPWVQALGITLSFRLDGLSLIFALLVSGIGTLIVVYAKGYLGNHPDLGQFYAMLLMFMASMLGLVLADNLIALFVFWELTSISSYLLIGFKHNEAASRRAAQQALLVTGAGGLVMLAGFVLLRLEGGTWELSTLLANPGTLLESPRYALLLSLILVGAFTKSAQMPFHFWLPGAMAAPTPVSAYLHSATMVKAGVYLLARLNPVLGGSAWWFYSLTAVGGLTALLAGYIAWQQSDLKRILAYSTVSALGVLVLLIGQHEQLALEAALVFLIVHSLYKGTLFMVAGIIDHETGTRAIEKLGGLRSVLPLTLFGGVLAALSMAGIPPLLGFVGKELIYETTLEAPSGAIFITVVAVLTNMLTILAAALVIVKPFFGPLKETPKHPHRAPVSLWLGPVVLGSFSLLAGLLVAPLGEYFISAGVGATTTSNFEAHLGLWHGLTPMLLLSGVTIAGGAGLYFIYQPARQLASHLNPLMAWGSERWYDLLLEGLQWLAEQVTNRVQTGNMRTYIFFVLLFSTLTTGFTLVFHYGSALMGFITPLPWAEIGLIGLILVTVDQVVKAKTWQLQVGIGAVIALEMGVFAWLQFSDNIPMVEMTVVTVMIIATFTAVRVGSRLMAVAAVGVVGVGMSLLFIFFGAPDLAITEFAVDTLSVILLVLVLYRLPKYVTFTNQAERVRDAIIAITSGALMSVLVLITLKLEANSDLMNFFAENSYVLAHGENVVNVILVDFRGIDTLGEITVLSVAAIGVYALLKLRPSDNADSSPKNQQEG